MKTFSLIITFYLLLLSCLPCADGQEFGKSESTKISAAADNKRHQNNNDICTPFCNCACCSLAVFQQIIHTCQIPKMVFQILKFPDFTASTGVNISLAIWQPPKMV